MKKRVLMSLVLLTIIGVGAVFAQQPTLDKLRFGRAGVSPNQYRTVGPANDSISGVVIIPETYDNMTVTHVDGFSKCISITSVTFPVGIKRIANSAFSGCTNLISVTFLGNEIEWNIVSATFPGDLIAKYRAGGAGTYTRSPGGTVWTKGGAVAAVNTSLDGVWETGSSGWQTTISGSNGVTSRLSSSPSGRLADAINKGYYKIGGQEFRNIRSTGNLTWSGQTISTQYNRSAPNVATGTTWVNCTITMSADGQTITVVGSDSTGTTVTYTRR
jgi:hypothetical protein